MPNAVKNFAIILGFSFAIGFVGFMAIAIVSFVTFALTVPFLLVANSFLIEAISVNGLKTIFSDLLMAYLGHIVLSITAIAFVWLSLTAYKKGPVAH